MEFVKFEKVEQFSVFDEHGLYIDRTWSSDELQACRDWNAEHPEGPHALSAIRTDEPQIPVAEVMECITIQPV